MCVALPVIAMVASAVGGAVSAYGQYQQGRAQEQIAKNNAVVAGYQAEDAQRRGEEEAQRIRRQAAMLKGQQRARAAAGGLDLGVGSIAELQDQTDFFAQVDQNTARRNADLESWQARAQAANFRAEGANARAAGTTGAFSTLLSTAGSVADKWYSFNPKVPSSSGGTTYYKGAPATWG